MLTNNEKIFMYFYINELDIPQSEKSEILNKCLEYDNLKNIIREHGVLREETYSIISGINLLSNKNNNPLFLYEEDNASQPSTFSKKIRGVAILAAILSMAYKVYKEYYSKAAKACEGKKGLEKQECMRNYKIEAINKRIDVLRNNRDKCYSSYDPEICAKSLDHKIEKLREKARKVKY